MGEVLRIAVDVYSPNHQKTIKYTGDHPSRTFKILPPLMRSIFRVTSTNFYEDEIKWDISTEDVVFYGVWRATHPEDGRTKFWIKVKVIGTQNSKTKKGTVTIYIHPYMITKMPYSNFIDKAIAKSYSYFFYGDQRRRYIDKELLYLKEFEEKVREALGIR